MNTTPDIGFLAGSSLAVSVARMSREALLYSAVVDARLTLQTRPPNSQQPQASRGQRDLIRSRRQTLQMPDSEFNRGDETEAYARRLAAGLGVPDFVYEPLLARTGSGTREISDGLLTIADDGLILQTKARQTEVGIEDTPERAKAWLTKQAMKALRQVRGTRRRLAMSEKTEIRSLRGFTRSVNGVDGWPGVVILDHPRVPDDFVIDFVDDAVFMTLDDWYGLHEWVRSTASVIDYVTRALESRLNPPLGQEPLRYGRIAHADHTAKGSPTSLPRLPFEPIEGEELVYAAVIEDWIEFVWPQDGPFPWEDPDEYRLIVEALDRIPPAHRVSLGKKVFDTIEQSLRHQRRASFFYRLMPGRYQYLYVSDVADNYDDPGRDHMGEVVALAHVRHAQALAARDQFEAGPTVLIARLDHGTRGVAYSFVYLDRDDIDMPGDIRWDICVRYGVFDGSKVVNVSSLGRNEPCPCGSGKKLKRCHALPG